MRCAATRELLQEWFDLSGTATIPAEASAHIRQCEACRDYVRAWDHIELDLQTLREAAPLLSSDFKVRFEERSANVRRPRFRVSPGTYLRWAAGTATAVIAAIAIGYALTGRGPMKSESPGSLAIVRPAQSNGYVPGPPALNGDLPLAQSR